MAEPLVYDQQPGEADVPQYSMGLPDAAPILPSDVINSRAERAAMGVGNILNKSYQDFLRDFQAGQEPAVRQQAASTIDAKKTEQGLTLLQQIVKTRPLTMDDAAIAAKFNQKTDPDAVIESRFAREYINHLKWPDTNPDDLVMNDSINRATDLVTKREYIQKALEDVSAKRESQTSFERFQDIAGTSIPFYSTVWNEIRNRLQAPPGVGFLEKLQPSEQMAAQASALYQQPWPVFKDSIDAIVRNLGSDNMLLLQQHLTTLLGQSTSDKVMNDLLPFIDVGLPLASAAGKGLNVSGRIIRYNLARSQLKDMIESIKQAQNADAPLAQVVTSAAGNLEEAAVTRATTDILPSNAGPAEHGAVEATHTIMNQDMTQRAANPGRYGQEIVNRIWERTVGMRDEIVKIMTTGLQVERVPEAVMKAKDVMQAYYNTIKDEYRGIRSNILNFSAPRRTPTGGWEYDIIFGDTRGNYFDRYTTAENWAKVQGFKDAAPVSAKGAGTKFYVKLTRNFDETSPIIRSASALLDETKTPDSLLKLFSSYIAGIRTPEETLALANALNRKAATYAPAKYSKLFKREAQVIRDLAKGKGIPRENQVSRLLSEVETDKTTVLSNRPESFQTSDNSVYAMNPVNRTTRTPTGETARPISSRTVYIYPSDLNAIRTTKANARLVQNGDTLELHTPTPGKGYSSTGSASFTDIPEVGKVPVQLFSPSTLNSRNAFRNVHIGEPITRIEFQQAGERVLTPKQRFQDWQDTLEAARDMPDPNNPGKKGYYFKSPGELEYFYQQNFHRLPSEAEVEAYFRFVDLNRFDFVMRQLAVHKYAARLGAEQYTLSQILKDGTKFDSDPFVGVPKTVLPHGDDVIVYIGDGKGKPKIYRLGTESMSTKTRKYFEDQIKQGALRSYEIYDPDLRPLKKFLGEDVRVRYILTNKIKSESLPYNLIPEREGGHVEHDYDQYLKQAKVIPEYIRNGPDGKPVFRFRYTGDVTAMPFMNGALGRDIMNKYNEMLPHMHAGDMAAAEQHFLRLGLPMDWAEFKSWFKPSYQTIDGVRTEIPPRFSSTEPFQMVPKGSMIIDMPNHGLNTRYPEKLFIDNTKEGSLARQFSVEFTGERDAYELYTVNNPGGLRNPVYSYEPATKVDAMSSLNRAINRIANSTYLDDYKIASVEAWLQEAKPYLNLKESQIATAPFWAFEKGEFLKGGKRTPEDVAAINKLEVARMQIKELTRTTGYFNGFLRNLEHKLADSVYTSENGLKRTGYYVAEHVIANTDNAAKLVRAMTFNLTMGLFNPVQAGVQAMTWFNIAAVAPGSVMQGTAATWLHGWTRVNSNPKIIAALDRALTRGFGWKSGQFREAMELLDRTGFEIVGGEHVTGADAFSNKIVKHGAMELLDGGQYFWKFGERAVRTSAWYTAYHEFRLAKPTGAISNSELQMILDRADLFAGNMSTASKSMLQKGILEFPSQFLGYQMRMMEQMTGKRLSMGEKARLFGVQSALYGVPMATGLFTFFPMGDLMKKYAYDHGYVVGDSWWESFQEGLVSHFINMITGHSFNIGPRFGNPGFDVIREQLYGDKSFWNALGGASWNTISTAFQNLGGLFRVFYSMFHDGGKEFPLTPDDLIEPLTQASTFNAGRRMLIAMNTYNWTNRKGQTLEKIEPLRAAFQTLTGLQSTQLADIKYKIWTDKDREENIKEGSKRYVENFGKAMQAMADHNPQQSDAYLKHALAYLTAYGVPGDKLGQIQAAANNANKSLLSRVDLTYYMRNVPDEMKQEYMKAYQRAMQIEKQRGQQ